MNKKYLICDSDISVLERKKVGNKIYSLVTERYETGQVWRIEDSKKPTYKTYQSYKRVKDAFDRLILDFSLDAVQQLFDDNDIAWDDMYDNIIILSYEEDMQRAMACINAQFPDLTLKRLGKNKIKII